MDYKKHLENAKSFSDIFEIVKETVRRFIGIDQAGLLVGVTDLGAHDRGFIGAFYSLDANMIIINKRPLARILQTNPSIYNYYLFHVMLHEYVHSIGFFDEEQARQLVYDISRHYFGAGHMVTNLAHDISRFMPDLTYPGTVVPASFSEIEFVKGIDKKNTNYIN